MLHELKEALEASAPRFGALEGCSVVWKGKIDQEGST